MLFDDEQSNVKSEYTDEQMKPVRSQSYYKSAILENPLAFFEVPSNWPKNVRRQLFLAALSCDPLILESNHCPLEYKKDPELIKLANIKDPEQRKQACS